MSDLNQLLLNFEYKQNFKDEDFYVSKSNYFAFNCKLAIKKTTNCKVMNGKGRLLSKIKSRRIPRPNYMLTLQARDCEASCSPYLL